MRLALAIRWCLRSADFTSSVRSVNDVARESEVAASGRLRVIS